MGKTTVVETECNGGTLGCGDEGCLKSAAQPASTFVASAQVIGKVCPGCNRHNVLAEHFKPVGKKKLV